MHGIAEWLLAGEAAWDEFLVDVAHDVYHTPGYAHVEADRMSAEPVALLSEHQGIRFLLPLLLRVIPGSDRLDAISPYGYPGPIASGSASVQQWAAAARSFVAAMRERQVVSCFVRMHPLLPYEVAGFEPAGRIVEAGTTVAVDLVATEDEIVGRLRSGHRREIRRARRDGLVISVDDWSLFAEFLSCYRETMDRVGASAEYYFDDTYYSGLRASLGNGLHLAAVHDDSKVHAAGLFFESCGIVQYHLSGARTASLHLTPTKLMVLDAGLWARSRGNRVLHLGGGLGGKTDALHEFKAGFSKWRLPFRTWRAVADPDAYRELTEDRGLPVGEDGIEFFPAYRGSGQTEATAREPHKGQLGSSR